MRKKKQQQRSLFVKFLTYALIERLTNYIWKVFLKLEERQAKLFFVEALL